MHDVHGRPGAEIEKEVKWLHEIPARIALHIQRRFPGGIPKTTRDEDEFCLDMMLQTCKGTKLVSNLIYIVLPINGMAWFREPSIITQF